MRSHVGAPRGLAANGEVLPMCETPGCPRVRVDRRHHADGTPSEEITMTRFMIERTVPGASELTQLQLAEISKTSNAAMASLNVPYRWITSYVVGDRIICVHEADDEDAIREHSRRGAFPVDAVTIVANEFGPDTADLLV
jgi:Protein of unknown function (DUF4242)